jgi:hypothetical protein
MYAQVLSADLNYLICASLKRVTLGGVSNSPPFNYDSDKHNLTQEQKQKQKQKATKATKANRKQQTEKQAHSHAENREMHIHQAPITRPP